MRAKMWRVGLCLALVTAALASVAAAPWPNVPRNGAHSVQAIFGGRDVIPMCIVPPRTFESGAAIPNGTTCTIVIYRSRDEGKPGTYTEEVGRGTGPVEREWIDVGAKVPPEGPNGGVVYLASCAIVNGEMSDLNNQYLTIVWAPGSFNVKEYPAAGSKPGAPPGRKPRPGPETYPSWLTELGALARGSGVATGAATGAAAYTLQTPPLRELDAELDTDIRLKASLKVDAAGALTGSTDLEPWLAHIRKGALVKRTEVQRNEVTGTLLNGALKGVIEIRVAIHAQQGNQKAVGTMTITTGLTGTRNAAGEIPGQANSQLGLVVTGFAPSSRQKAWTFTATRTAGGGGKTVLLAPDSMGNAMAAPGLGFETQASKAGGGIIGGEFQKSIVGTIELDVGGSMLFTLDGRRPNMKMDSKLGRMVSVTTTPRMLPQAPQWYVGPGGVLESTPVGNGVRVKAVGEGMGEVWARSLWEIPTPGGGTETGAMVNIWVVPVGAEARGRVNQSRTGTTTQIGGFTGERIGKVIISGRAVRAGMGVPGAQVALWRDPEGVYYKPDWVTGSDGSFRITCDGSLPGGGLIPGRYEVMVQWHAGNTDTAAILRDNTKTFVDDDLWPRKRHMITINKETAASGEIAAGPIQLTRIADMDWSQRE